MKTVGWITLTALVSILVWLSFGRSKAPSPIPATEEVSEQKITEPLTTLPPAPITQPKNKTALPSSSSANLSSMPISAPQETGQSQQKTAESTATPISSGVILRDEAGNLKKVSQRNALRACIERGMHLPTIRELARFGKSRGARGIVEVDQIRDQDREAGAVLVTATNPDGKKDAFYYSPVGYVTRTDEGKEQSYWSSSTCVGCVVGGPEAGGTSSYSFDSNGEIQDHYNYLGFAVRCLPDR